LITTIPGRDFRFAKAPLASKFAPGEFVIFSALARKIAIARWAALLQAGSYGGAVNIARWAALLQAGSYGGTGNIARWAALLRPGSYGGARNIARWAALLQAGSYGGAGNIARWAALLRSRLIEQGVAINAMTLHHALEIL
jgi:hypothetical protein